MILWKKEKMLNMIRAGDLITPEYFDAIGVTKETYIQNLKDFDFKNSYKITDYSISEVSDYNDEIKRVKILIKGNNSNGENTSEEIYTVKGSTIAPMGFVSIKTNIGYSEGTNSFEVGIPEYIEGTDSMYLKVKWNNKTSADVTLGWAGSGEIIVETDQGTFKGSLGAMRRIEVGYNATDIIEVPGAKGVIKKITVGTMYPIKGGLPAMDEGRIFEFEFKL